MSYEFTLENKKGMVLLLVFIVMATLTAITVAFLYMSSTQLKGSGYDVASNKALWLAEAGVQKAIWNLKTPVGSGGQGEDWTTAGTAEILGNGSYTMVVDRWDFALAANGSSASAISQQGGNKPAKAIDGNDGTFWQGNTPTMANPQDIIITFPYTLTINKVRFLASTSARRPKDYSWQVSTDGINYTSVLSIVDNTSLDVTNTFTAVPNVKYLKLQITANGGGSGVRIATLEAIGSKITSTGTVSVMNRKVAQTVVADDVTQIAADEIDWNEIVPAI
jgi:hypothetical protein